ncbi:MAG: hypothetical protein WAM89_09850 [Terriglobales bacterium]
MITASVLSLSTPSQAQIGIGISVRIGPPALPVYEQPLCPGPGYLWTPGYWAWNEVGGYYWVPGTWVVAPVGLLWTPGYWGFAGGFYGWHAGYWGPHVGFYGGINYGFGYGGVGFAGGEWRGGSFFYNRAVMHVDEHVVTNVYNRTVVVNNVHTSFNGPGGIGAHPTPQEESYAHEQHTAALASQTEHEHAASQNKALFASENHGRPAIAATGRPGEFSGRGVVAARAAGAAYHEPKMSPQEARSGGIRGEASRNERSGNEAGRKAERSNERPAARPENREARNNEGRGNEGRNNKERNNQMENRGQKAPRENSRAAKQERQAPKHAQKQGKSEPKQNKRER